MARTGMAYLINDLRVLTEAGYDDFRQGTLVLWTDDTLQSILDRNRQYHNQFDLNMEPTYGVGTVTYTKYYTGLSHWENAGTVQGDGGTIIAGTAYTFTPETGEIDFAANTDGAGYVLTGYTFNLYAAAAEVWRRKMGYYASAYDISGDGQSLSRSQLIKNAKEMMTHYQGLASSFSGGAIYAERGDM